MFKTILCAILVAGACCADAIEPSQLHQDFDIFRTALEKGHSGIYRYVPKTELDKIFDAAAASLNRPLSTLEYYRVLLGTVARIECGHTSVSLPKAFLDRVSSTEPLLPVDVAVLNGRVYGFRDYAPGTLLAGKEIVSINGSPAADLSAKILSYIPADAANPALRIWRLTHTHNFSLLLYTIAGVQGPFHVVYLENGQRRTVTLAGISRGQLNELGDKLFPGDRGPKENAAVRWVENGAAAVLRISSFGGFVDQNGKEPLSPFLDKTFAEMNSRGTKTLILDLRDNGGGEDELGKELFAHLTGKPFQYYDDLVINALSYDFLKYSANPERTFPVSMVKQKPDGRFTLVAHGNMGLQQPRPPNFSGTVLTLINGGSFSTTAEFLSILSFHKRSTFIGEESGGGYYGNTSGGITVLTLPNSGLMLRLPVTTYYIAVSSDKKHGSRGIAPDYPVTYSIQEILTGADKEMDLALKLAKEKK